MKIEISDINGVRLAEIISGGIEISDVQSALDLMADCDYQGYDN